jgi:hypothetical protein
MADKKVTELSAITNLSGDDLLLVVNDPSGTPSSNKVTVTNLFANVVPNVVHKGTVTARGNTTFSGTTMTVSANATYSGTLTVSGTLVESGISTRSGVQVFNGNTIHNDTLFANGGLVISSSVSSGGSNIIGKNGNLNANNAIADGSITVPMLQETPIANTTARTLISDRMQVANTTTLVNDRMQVANTNALVNDRLQVANATAQFANSAEAIMTGNTSVETLLVSGVVISSAANGEGVRIATQHSNPATANAVTEGLTQGTIFYSNTHLYIVTDQNTIKRVTLSTF